METSRLRHTCSVITSSSPGNKRCSTCIFAIVIILLHVFSIVSKTWYMLYLDLDRCSSCGTLIVSIGTIFENSIYNAFVDDEDIYFNHHIRSNNAIVDFKSSLTGRQPNEFVIETGLYVYVGLWAMSVCLVDGRTCTDVDYSTSSIILRNTQPIGDMLESVYDSRPFLFLAIASHVLMLFLTRVRPAGATVSDVKITAGVEAVSAVFSLMAVVIAGMPYLTSTSFFHVVTPLLPWALMSTILAAYLSFVVAFQTWNSQTTSRMTSFRSWQARQMYKYYA